MASQKGGKWQGSYYDIHGKRRKQSFATQKQAEAWERAGEVERDQMRAGLAPMPAPVRTLSSLWPGWVARRSAKRRKDDESRWRNHIEPFFGQDDIDSIDKKRLDEFVRHMEEKTAARPGQLTKKPLRPNTIKNCLVLVAQLVADLTERRLVYKYKVGTSGYSWLEQPEDVARFLDECNEEWFRVMCAIAFYAGLRKGEIAGLHRKEISFENKTIEVSYSYGGPVKSKHHRYAPLPPELVKILKPWVADMAPDDLVIKINGEMMAEDYGVSMKARRTAKRAGTPSINFHQTRHTFCSHLAQTQPLTVVQQLAGHIDPKTTQRYSHMNPLHVAKSPAVHLSFKAPKKRKQPTAP